MMRSNRCPRVCSRVFFVMLALTQVNGLLSAQTAFPPERYAEVELADFLSLPEARARIDFENIDYPLLHAAVFYLTNEQRRNNRLRPLEHDLTLERAAEVHSRDMREHGFFSHTSPVRGRETVGDRVGEAGFRGSGYGENIAISFGLEYEAGRGVFNPEQNDGYFSYEYRGDPILGHTYLSAAREVVSDWMDSPGHRANILRRQFRYLGVGAAHFKDERFYGMDKFYFTQNFGL